MATIMRCRYKNSSSRAIYIRCHRIAAVAVWEAIPWSNQKGQTHLDQNYRSVLISIMTVSFFCFTQNWYNLTSLCANRQIKIIKRKCPRVQCNRTTVSPAIFKCRNSISTIISSFSINFNSIWVEVTCRMVWMQAAVVAVLVTMLCYPNCQNHPYQYLKSDLFHRHQCFLRQVRRLLPVGRMGLVYKEWAITSTSTMVSLLSVI